MGRSLTSIIEDEERAIRSRGGYELDKRYAKIVGTLMGKDEHVVLGARQGYLETFSPGIMIATNRRILIIKLSFWGLYSGHSIMLPSDFVNVHYDRIVETEYMHGRFLGSVILKVIGGGEVRFNGVRKREAIRMIGFLERISMENEREHMGREAK